MNSIVGALTHFLALSLWELCLWGLQFLAAVSTQTTLDNKKMETKKAKKNKKAISAPAENLIAIVDDSIQASIDLDESKGKKSKKKSKNNADNSTPVTPIDSNVPRDEILSELPSQDECNTSKKKSKKNKSASQDITESEEHSVDINEKKNRASRARGNYIIHPDVESMSNSTVEQYRQETGIAVTPESESENFKPITSFHQLDSSLLDFCPEIGSYLAKKNFPKPSPIQVCAP
jgi:hypothetical protein